jgi:hypothetical protein
MLDMKRLNLRELQRRAGVVVERRRRQERGFPAGHWEFLKRFPKFKDDSGELIFKDHERG